MTTGEHRPRLYVVRHGHYDKHILNLTAAGRAQIVTARTKLLAEIGSRPTRILASPQQRALESARLLKNGSWQFSEDRDVVGWLNNDLYAGRHVDIPGQWAIRSLSDGNRGAHSFILVMHRPDIFMLMLSMGDGRGVTPIPLGGCWEIATSSGESHRRVA